LSVDDLTTTGAVADAAASPDEQFTTVNITTAGASKIADLSFTEATAVTISGDGDLTATKQAFAAKAVITNGSTGDVTLGSDIAAGQKYVGGAGVDTVSFAAGSTTASTLGAGDDVATFAGVAGTGGSVDGGDGIDTVVLAAADANTLSAATAFAADIAGFERLRLLAASAATVVDLGNLDDINYVTSEGATDTLGIDGFSSGGTFVQTGVLAGAATLTGAFTGKSDIFNIGATSDAGLTNTATLTIGAVETVTITLTDTDDTAVNVYKLNLVADAATTVTVSGNAGIDFTTGSLKAITKLDASGVTEDGVVTFTANAGLDTTIIGGAGDDDLTGSTGADTITGGAGDDFLDGDDGDDTLNGGDGDDFLDGGDGDDTLNGGDGDDIITGGTGKDTLTGGAGEDIFVFAAGDSTTADPDVITDFSAEDDIIRLTGLTGVAGPSAIAGTGAGLNVEVDADGKVTFAANDDTLAEKLVALEAESGVGGDIGDGKAVFFEHGGNSYIFYNGAAAGTGDLGLVQLTGVTGLDTLTFAAGANFSFA
jgi:S-layer protein